MLVVSTELQDVIKWNIHVGRRQNCCDDPCGETWLFIARGDEAVGHRLKTGCCRNPILLCRAPQFRQDVENRCNNCTRSPQLISDSATCSHRNEATGAL